MIKQFDNIDKLIVEIETDKSTNNYTYRRFPVRFIFLYNFKTLQNLVLKLNKINVRKLELSDYLPKEDGWFTIQQLIDELKHVDENKDFIVLPFSEVARFYNKDKFNNLFSQLTELRNFYNTRRRIYLPLLGIRNRFEQDFFEKFSRKKEWTPVWEIKEETVKSKILVFSENLSINPNIIQTVNHSKGWLTIWKKDLSSPTLCLSACLSYLYKNTVPDEIFDFEKIETKKELIEKVYGLEIPIPYIKTEGIFWDLLIDKVTKNNYTTFSRLVKQETNTTNITINNFIDLWLTINRTNFEKWLLKNHIITYDCLKYKYLYKVLKDFQDFDDLSFLKQLWLFILKENRITNILIEEREELLQQFYQNKSISLPKNIENKIENYLNNIDNDELKISLLTGILPSEKTILFKKAKVNKAVIEKKYPELFHYLSEFNFDNLTNETEWINNYFAEYKVAKVNNQYTEAISSLIKSKNKDEESFYKWYYTFPDVKIILSKFKLDETIWIDALGVEWMSLIEYLLKKKEYRIESKQVAKVNLPTTTDTNRFENALYTQDFDKYIHSQHFIYPQTIIEEIDILKNIFERKINLDEDKRIAIISDHGLSALVRLNANKSYDFKTDHEGRYVKIENANSLSDDENYIKFENKYLIALRHNSLSNKPSREVHGGCTPEEVLVPVIIISNKTIEKKEEIKYTIKLLSEEIYKKEPVVSFTITPEPKQKPVLLDNKLNKFVLKNISENNWNVKLEHIPTGKQSYKLKIGNFELEFIIDIKSGLKEEELF